jgi:hypothetical protein
MSSLKLERLWFYDHDTATVTRVSEAEADKIGVKNEAADDSFLLRASDQDTANQLASDWSAIVQDRSFPPADAFALRETDGRYTFITRYP